MAEFRDEDIFGFHDEEGGNTPWNQFFHLLCGEVQFHSRPASCRRPGHVVVCV